MPTIVVTGAAGQLGRVTTAALLARGVTVHAYDRAPVDDLGFPVFAVDLTRLPDDFRWPDDADVLLHLAGLRDVLPPTGSNLTALLQANVEALAGALAACGAGVCHVVYVSSMAVYSGQAPVPTPEDGPVAPETMYGLSKWLGERVCGLFHSARPDVGVTIVRLVQVYGPGSGQEHLAVYQLIDQAIEQRGVRLTCVPKLVRDLIYIDDAAEALALAALLRPEGVVNVSGMEPFSMDELVGYVEAAIGSPLAKSFGDDRGEDRALSGDRFRRLTGFVPSTSLREGVARELRRVAAERGPS